MATRVAGMRPALRSDTVIFRQPRAQLCPLLFTSHQAPAKSSALSFSCPKYLILARCCLFPLQAGLAVSLCSVGCSLFLQSLCWSASPVGGGQSGLHPQLSGGPCHIQHLLRAPQQQHQGSALLTLGISLWAIGEGCRRGCVAKSISRSKRSPV